MTNFEKFGKEIKVILDKNYSFSIKNNKPDFCSSAPCSTCLFFDSQYPCGLTKLKWLFEEYKEPEID